MDKTAVSALFAWVDRELWLVTAEAEQGRSGLIATFVMQASIVPELPRVVIILAKQHYTAQLIESSGTFGLHLLGELSHSWVRDFGLQSGRETDKFANRDYKRAETGAPILTDGIGWMDCRVEAKTDIGDRILFVGEVVASEITNYGPPLTIKQVMEDSPPEIRSEIRKQLHHDTAIDSRSIREWRKNRRPTS